MYSETSTQIYFFYPVETIMDRVKMYSQTLGKFTSEDDSHISDDEQALIEVEMSKAISQIFQTAYKLSKGIQESIFFNKSLAIDTIDYGLVYGFRMNNYQGKNENIVPVVDQNIEKLWTSLVIQKWFMLTGKNDLAASEQALLNVLWIEYNNSLTELYKPKINDVTPVYSTSEVEVDDEGNIIEETPTTTTMEDPVYYDTFDDFPETGVVNMTYVDNSAGAQYYWNGTQYLPFASSNRTYSVEFEGVNMVVVNHNLGKLVPTVKMTDADGDDWDVDYEPDDENSGTVSWENNKTGTLYLS